MKATLATLALSTVLLASSLVAQVEEGDARKTLAGLRGVFVMVAPLTDEAKRHGLAEAQVKADVESQVKQAGITVLTKDDLRRTPGMPYLYVLPVIEHPQATPNAFAYHVAVEVFQLVVLTRNPDIFGIARTWKANGGPGAAVEENVAASTKDAVHGMTDQFIAAFLAANPKH